MTATIAFRSTASSNGATELETGRAPDDEQPTALARLRMSAISGNLEGGNGLSLGHRRRDNSDLPADGRDNQNGNLVRGVRDDMTRERLKGRGQRITRTHH